MSFSFKKFFGGINLVPQNSSAVSADGDLRYNSSTNKLELYNGGVDPLVTEADTATLTNKSIDGNENTVTNITATINANLTGPITSVGNATAIASQTGTGSTFVVQTSPTLISPALGTPTALVGTNITGTASSLTVGAAASATSATTSTNLAGGLGGQIPYQSSASTTALLANGSAGQVLSSQGTTLAPQWINGLTNPMTTGGDIIYGGASGTPTRLANGNNGQVLTSSGGTAAPTYTTPPAQTHNFIINGNMFYDQNKEGGAYESTGTEVYSLDQWRFDGASGGSGAFSIQQTASNAPGFPLSLNAVVTTSQASLSATDNFHIEYPIEGSAINGLKYGTANAATTSLSFWAQASTTGTYSIALMEGTNTRSYVTTFTITVANTWQYITINGIPGDTSGTYQSTDGTFGLKILWSLGVGSTYSTSTTNTWQGAAFWNATGSTQLIQQSNGSGLFITGVQFEIGPIATQFEYLPPSTQLILLQRYYYKTISRGTAVAQNAGAAGALSYIAQTSSTTTGNGVQLRYPVHMSASPSVVTYNPGAANANWRNGSGSTDSGVPTLFSASSDGVFILNPQVSGDSAASIIYIHLVADARLGGS